MPVPVFAQTLGDMMCSVSRNIAPFESLFVALAYITGSVLIGSGLFQLAYYTDVMATGRQYGISRPKGYLVAGASLLALPAFIRLMVNSIFNSSFNGGGGLSGCYAGSSGIGIFASAGGGISAGIGGIAGVSAGGGVSAGIGVGGGFGTGLDLLMMNLVSNIKGPMIFLLSVLSILMGIFMIMRGLIKGSKFGQDAKASLPNIFANLIIGTILYTIGTSLDSIMATVFGDSSVWGDPGIGFSIAPTFGIGTGILGTSPTFEQAIYAALTFVQIIGFIAFIRGWLILRDAVEGQGQKTVPMGLTHILGGVLAVNIYRFLEMMDATFGTGFFNSGIL